MHLTQETLAFTRSDGRVIEFSLIKDILDDPECPPLAGALSWATLMQLQGVMEYQDILAKQNAQLAESLNAVAAGLQALLAKANQPPPAMPDPAKMVSEAFAAVGLSPDIIKAAMSGTPGVTFTPTPNGSNGGGKP
jgi:hypothetical protein